MTNPSYLGPGDIRHPTSDGLRRLARPDLLQLPPLANAPDLRGSLMARLTIELHHRPSGCVTCRISLASDDDITPREHERDHRRAVRALFPQIDLDRDDSPRFGIERESA